MNGVLTNGRVRQRRKEPRRRVQHEGVPLGILPLLLLISGFSSSPLRLDAVRPSQVCCCCRC